MTLTLLGRGYCHLCDEMRAALAPLLVALGATLVELDVDADPGLEARWGDLVPVLLAGEPESGAEICHFRLDPVRAAAALRGEPLAARTEIR
ncbi:MAG: glutaredoxin family protein [Betaproteobacteria bacterium]